MGVCGALTKENVLGYYLFGNGWYSNRISKKFWKASQATWVLLYVCLYIYVILWKLSHFG